MADETTYYSVDLGTGAVMRGDRVICQGLGWAGANRSLVNVRVVHSTLPSYRVGERGLIRLDRLRVVTERR